MGLYIVFNNFYSFLDKSESADSIEEDIRAAVADSAAKAGQVISAGDDTAVSAELLIETLPEVDDYLESSLLAASEMPAAVSARPVPSALEINTETPELPVDEQNTNIQTNGVGQNDIYEEFQSLLKKFEISLQYRCDFADMFNTITQTEDSRNSGNLIEKSLNKQRAAQQEDFERRFQEKQADSFKEHLKQKKTVT